MDSDLFTAILLARNDRTRPQGRVPVHNEKTQRTNDRVSNDSVQGMNAIVRVIASVCSDDFSRLGHCVRSEAIFLHKQTSPPDKKYIGL
ncbi:MAG: hypothetical protein U0586_11475 [Candidatus Brocadiaceae bacterium]